MGPNVLQHRMTSFSEVAGPAGPTKHFGLCAAGPRPLRAYPPLAPARRPAQHLPGHRPAAEGLGVGHRRGRPARGDRGLGAQPAAGLCRAASAKYNALPGAACRCGLVPPACACSPPHGADAPSDDWAQFCQGGPAGRVAAGSRRSSSGGLAAELAYSHVESRARGMRRSFSLPSIEVA